MMMKMIAGADAEGDDSGEGYMAMSSTCTPVMSNPEYFGHDFQGDVTDGHVSMETDGGRDVFSPRQPLPSNHDHYYNCPPPPRPVLSRSSARDRQSSQVWQLTVVWLNNVIIDSQKCDFPSYTSLGLGVQENIWNFCLEVAIFLYILKQFF